MERLAQAKQPAATSALPDTISQFPWIHLAGSDMTRSMAYGGCKVRRHVRCNNCNSGLLSVHCNSLLSHVTATGSSHFAPSFHPVSHYFPADYLHWACVLPQECTGSLVRDIALWYHQKKTPLSLARVALTQCPSSTHDLAAVCLSLNFSSCACSEHVVVIERFVERRMMYEWG